MDIQSLLILVSIEQDKIRFLIAVSWLFSLIKSFPFVSSFTSNIQRQSGKDTLRSTENNLRLSTLR